MVRAIAVRAKQRYKREAKRRPGVLRSRSHEEVDTGGRRGRVPCRALHGFHGVTTSAAERNASACCRPAASAQSLPGAVQRQRAASAPWAREEWCMWGCMGATVSCERMRVFWVAVKAFAFPIDILLHSALQSLLFAASIVAILLFPVSGASAQQDWKAYGSLA